MIYQDSRILWSYAWSPECQTFFYTLFQIILGSSGLLCILMAFAVACGICSLLGISYGPVHTALPFLLLGIGVDDMFVIVACWKNLNLGNSKVSLPEKIGRTLQHAGVSITVTTMTDIAAFLVGSLTVSVSK